MYSKFDPQSQTSERNVMEEFVNEATFHRERPSPELLKNQILRDLFNVHSFIYLDSSKLGD